LDDAASHRNANGKFTAGNPGGPGGARRRSLELREAAEEAISPDHLRAMMRKAMVLALNGNLQAMRFVAERILGRPADPPSEGVPLGVSLPRLVTAADCGMAIDLIQEGLTKGAIDRDTAKVLLDVVQVRMKAIDLNDHEQRLAELESAAKAVDFGGRRG